jgi:hypothetical protein
MDDPVKRREMGDFGRARVMSDLGWHVTSRNLLSAYGFLFPAVSLKPVSITNPKPSEKR